MTTTTPPGIYSKFKKFKIGIFTWRQCQIHFILQRLPSPSSHPQVGKEEADIQSRLLWETGVVVVLILNSTMSTQPPYGVVHWGQTGHFDSQGIKLFPYDHSWHCSRPGATTASSRPEHRARANSTAGVAYKRLGINLGFQRRLEMRCPCPVTDWFPWGEFNSQRGYWEFKRKKPVTVKRTWSPTIKATMCRFFLYHYGILQISFSFLLDLMKIGTDYVLLLALYSQCVHYSLTLCLFWCYH